MSELERLRDELRQLGRAHEELRHRHEVLLAHVLGPGVAGPGVAGPGVAGPGVAGPGVAGPGVAEPPAAAQRTAEAAVPRITRRLALGGALAATSGFAAAISGVGGGLAAAAVGDGTAIDNGRANTSSKQTLLSNAGTNPPGSAASTAALTETDHLLLIDNSASSRPTGGGLRVIGRGNGLSATSTSPGSAIEARTSVTDGTGMSAIADGVGGVGLVASGGSTGIRAGGTAIAGLFAGGAYGIAVGAGRPLVFTGGHGSVGPPSTQGRVGEVAFDLEGSLFLCVADGVGAAGTAGSATWRKIAGPATAGALHLLPEPRRVYDSRPGSVPVGPSNGGPKGSMGDNETRVIDATANGAPVPRDAVGLLFNLAVTATNPSGFLTAWGSGGQPLASAMNWSSAGTTLTSSVTIALGPNATFLLFCGGGGAAHVIVDVAGYYR